jgi:hypothetical protein
MITKGTIVIPKQDLIFEDKSISFLKGREYTVMNDCNTLEKAQLINEDNENHTIGCWFTKFKIKK